MPTKPSLYFVVIAMVVMTTSSFALAQDKKIGVAVSAVINGSPGTGPEVSESLGAALATTLKATVIAGSEAQALLPEAARTETCLGDSSCLVEAGKALGVDELLMLIIVDSVEEVKVEATWVNVATGQTALRPSITASKSADSMAVQFAASASSLLPDIELRVQVADDTAEPLDDVVVPVDSNSTTTGGSVSQTAPGGHHMSSLGKQLFIGGAVALGASLGYGAYRYADCGGLKCAEGKDRPGLDAAVDVLGAAGAISLSVAAYLYFSSDSETAPVALNVSSQSVGLSLGGLF